MHAKRIDYTNRRTHSTQDTTANKRSRWICNQCKRQYCGAKPCPFCYRITGEAHSIPLMPIKQPNTESQ